MKRNWIAIPLFALLCNAFVTQSAATDETGPQELAVAAQPDKKGDGKGDGRAHMFARCAAFSPDGLRVAVGFGQKAGARYHGPRLKIWDIGIRKEADYWPLPPGEKAPAPDKAPAVPHAREYHAVSFVAYLPGGKEILTVEDDSMCRIWKAEEGKVVREFSVGERGGFGAALTADGKKLMTLAPRGFTLWEVPTGRILNQKEICGNSAYSFGISRNGERAFFRYAQSDKDPTYMVYWDLKNDKVIQALKVDIDKENGRTKWNVIIPLLFSPDGRTVLAARNQNGLHTIVLCDVDTLKQVKAVSPTMSYEEVIQAQRAVFSPGGVQTASAVFSPDGKKLLSVDIGRKDLGFTRIDFRDLSKNEKLWTLPNRPELNHTELLAFSPASDVALFVTHELVLMETRKGKVVGKLDMHVFGRQ